MIIFHFDFQGREPATIIRTMIGKIGLGIAFTYAVVYYFKYNANVSTKML